VHKIRAEKFLTTKAQKFFSGEVIMMSFKSAQKWAEKFLTTKAQKFFSGEVKMKQH